MYHMLYYVTTDWLSSSTEVSLFPKWQKQAENRITTKLHSYFLFV